MLPGLRSSCAKPARLQPNTYGNPRRRHGVWASPLTIENARDVTDLDAMFLTVKGVSVLLVADDAEFTAQRFELARLGLNRLPTSQA